MLADILSPRPAASASIGVMIAAKALEMEDGEACPQVCLFVPHHSDGCMALPCASTCLSNGETPRCMLMHISDQ